MFVKVFVNTLCARKGVREGVQEHIRKHVGKIYGSIDTEQFDTACRSKFNVRLSGLAKMTQFLRATALHNQTCRIVVGATNDLDVTHSRVSNISETR